MSFDVDHFRENCKLQFKERCYLGIYQNHEWQEFLIFNHYKKLYPKIPCSIWHSFNSFLDFTTTTKVFPTTSVNIKTLVNKYNDDIFLILVLCPRSPNSEVRKNCVKLLGLTRVLIFPSTYYQSWRSVQFYYVKLGDLPISKTELREGGFNFSFFPFSCYHFS